jgi:hypothetical protein
MRIDPNPVAPLFFDQININIVDEAMTRKQVLSPSTKHQKWYIVSDIPAADIVRGSVVEG